MEEVYEFYVVNKGVMGRVCCFLCVGEMLWECDVDFVY